MRTLLGELREYPVRRRYGPSDFTGVPLEDLGWDAQGRERYVASRFLPTARAFRRLALQRSDVVVDLGCGKGLAVLVAAEHPVRRVIGVELVPELAVAAQANVERNHRRLRSPVEIIATDVLDWSVPDDVTVVYAYSPFYGEIF